MCPRRGLVPGHRLLPPRHVSRELGGGGAASAPVWDLGLPRGLTSGQAGPTEPLLAGEHAGSLALLSEG